MSCTEDRGKLVELGPGNGFGMDRWRLDTPASRVTMGIEELSFHTGSTGAVSPVM